MSKQHSEAAKAYRGDHAFVTTGNERSVTVRITREEFARLDTLAREANVTRSALATRYVLRAMQ
jgi:hypothetical protein